jgi:hypothetical protein
MYLYMGMARAGRLGALDALRSADCCCFQRGVHSVMPCLRSCARPHYWPQILATSSLIHLEADAAGCFCGREAEVHYYGQLQESVRINCSPHRA